MSNAHEIVFLRRIAVVLIRVAAIVWLSQVIWHVLQDVYIYVPDYPVLVQGQSIDWYGWFWKGSYLAIAARLWVAAP
ncbi:MAG: hypothetical protein AAFN41_11425, partial [Planctomycetota bacterium]